MMRLITSLILIIFSWCTAKAQEEVFIEFDLPPSADVLSSIPLSAYASSGASVSFSIISGPGSISGNILYLNRTGIVVVRARAVAPGPPVIATQSISVNRLNQITYGSTLPSSIPVFSTVGLFVNSSSGLAYNFSIAGGPGTISENVLTLSATGTVTINAFNDGNDIYNPAGFSQSIVVNRANPSVFITSPLTGNVGDAVPLSVSTGGSTGAVIYSATNGSGKATVIGNTLSLTQRGTVTVKASIAADANYNAATVSQVFTIMANPVISFTSASTGLYGGSITLAVNKGGSTGVATYSVTNGTGTATLSASKLTLTGLGTVNITANVAASTNYYNAGSATQTITVVKGNPSVTFTSASSGAIGSSVALAVNKGGSTGAVSYSIINGTGTATLTGSNLLLTALGTVTITANVDADANYNAKSVSQTFTIKAIPTVTFTSSNTGVNGTSAALAVNTAGSSGTVTYSVTNGSGTATVSGSTLSMTKIGTVTVKATVAADANYVAKTVNQTFIITKGNPTISFVSVSSGPYAGTIALSVSMGGSTGAVTYLVTNGTGSASVSGSILSLNGVGTVTITANVASDANYFAGSASQVISIYKATPTVVFNSPQAGQYRETIPLAASAPGSTGAISYSVQNSTGIASVSGNILNLLGAGDVTVTANITGDDNYTSGMGSQTVTIIPAYQYIIFNLPPDYCLDSASLQLPSTSSVGLPLRFTISNTNVARISGYTLMMISPGTTTVTAYQDGDYHNYMPARQVNMTITVISPPQTTISTSGPTNFCQGGSVVLTASPGSSYSWSTGETSQSIAVSNTGAYYVTITNASGCSAVSSPTSVIVSPGYGSITSNGDFCNGYIELQAGSGYDYQWSSGHTYQTIYAFNEGAYVVWYTNAQGCRVYAGYYVSCYGYRTAPTPKVKPKADSVFTTKLYPNFNSVRLQSDNVNETPNQNRYIDGKVESNLPDSVVFYPNPANNDLTIQLPEATTRAVPVKLFDQLGKMIYTTVVPSGQSSKTINTSDFISGMYFLLIESDKSSFKKVLIVHEK